MRTVRLTNGIMCMMCMSSNCIIRLLYAFNQRTSFCKAVA